MRIWFFGTTALNRVPVLRGSSFAAKVLTTRNADRKFSLPAQAGTPRRREEETRSLVERLKKLASDHGYTKKQIATELGVSLTAVYQWSTGYTLTAKPETIEKLKKFLVANRVG
jgi:aryl-alcohol dehydrogenase-like predicted oxidoreductase